MDALENPETRPRFALISQQRIQVEYASPLLLNQRDIRTCRSLYQRFCES